MQTFILIITLFFQISKLNASLILIEALLIYVLMEDVLEIQVVDTPQNVSVSVIMAGVEHIVTEV